VGSTLEAGLDVESWQGLDESKSKEQASTSQKGDPAKIDWRGKDLHQRLLFSGAHLLAAYPKGSPVLFFCLSLESSAIFSSGQDSAW
jgi:hypothetical protein